MIKIKNDRENPEVISYMATRRAIGILGIMLPVVLLGVGSILGYKQMMPSISHYYYTYMITIFTGTLCAVGLFLITYKGFSKLDDIATNLAGVCAFGIALFPTGNLPDKLKDNTIFKDGVAFPDDAIHYSFAAVFFITLALISIFLFTQTKKNEKPTRDKIVRNRIYRICGILMLLFVAMVPVAAKIPSFENYNTTFWLEMASLWAFGFSWLTKGELISKDKPKLQPEQPSILQPAERIGVN